MQYFFIANLSRNLEAVVTEVGAMIVKALAEKMGVDPGICKDCKRTPGEFDEDLHEDYLVQCRNSWLTRKHQNEEGL